MPCPVWKDWKQTEHERACRSLPKTTASSAATSSFKSDEWASESCRCDRQSGRQRNVPEPHGAESELKQLRFTGMIKALEEQAQNPEIETLAFEERLGLLVDRELDERETRRLKRRLKQAKLRQEASIEDIDLQAPRGLDKALLATLTGCTWIRHYLNVIITGPTGVGKSYLATALAHKACLEGYKGLYQKLSRLPDELRIARADGTYGKRLVQLSKLDVLVFDDWGLAKLTPESQRDLLEVLDDRHGRRSTIVTSQLPVDQWHDAMPDPTIADAILDRLIHNANRIELKGETRPPCRQGMPGRSAPSVRYLHEQALA